MFDQPSGGNMLKPADHNGHLVLFTAVHGIEKVLTQYSDDKQNGDDTARVDYVCLDCQPVELVEQALVFKAGMVNKMRGVAGKGRMLLARIGQAPSSKPGANPAWVLTEFAPGTDDVRAQAWLTAHAVAGIQQPAAVPTPAPSAATPPVAPGQGLTPEQQALLAQLQAQQAAAV